MSNRNRTLDIAKSICIVLMVIGHSGCPSYLHNFIYMFHMPCFFFISGWLLNDKYLLDLKKGLLQKAKSSYSPFVKWTLIFLLFHNVFTTLHIYDTYYTLPIFIEETIRTLTLRGSEQLLGGFWFLISLFWASVGSLLFLYVLKKHNKLTYINISGGIIVILLISTFEHYLPIQIPQMFREQTLLAMAFYLTGYLCKKMGIKFHCLYTCLLIVPAIAACFMQLEMQTEGVGIFMYLISIFGIFAIMSLSQWLSGKKVSLALTYIGDKTLYILVFHFLAFKVVTALYLYANELPFDILSQFPVPCEMPEWMWLFYTFAGVTIPLLFYELLNGLTRHIKFDRPFDKSKSSI